MSTYGKVEWIGLRPQRGMPMRATIEVYALQGRGLEGDRAARRPGGKRQVTLVQWEHLGIIAAACGKDRMPPELLRRNIVVSGIDLLELMNQRVAIGAAILEIQGYCAPCDRMEQSLGAYGRESMMGRGGVTAIVHQGGAIRLADAVRSLDVGQHVLSFG